MPAICDGPVSPLFTPLPLAGNAELTGLSGTELSPELLAAAPSAPSGACVCRGIPFVVGKVALLAGDTVLSTFAPIPAPWLVFMHTSDIRPFRDEGGVPLQPLAGIARLGEHAANYVMCYADGEEIRVAIRRRFQLGLVQLTFGWGENCFEAVIHPKICARAPAFEQASSYWGDSQMRVSFSRGGAWLNWLWAWENPRPEIPLVGLRFEPVSGVVVVSAVSAGQVSSSPLRWMPRQKAVLTLPEGVSFNPALDTDGMLEQVRLDLGQVISACPRPLYPREQWAQSRCDDPPPASPREVIIEYTAHPQARFCCPGQPSIPVAALAASEAVCRLRTVAPARQQVRLQDRGTGEHATGAGAPAPARRGGGISGAHRPQPPGQSLLYGRFRH